MSERIAKVIEALGRYEPCDEDGSVCVANRLAVEEARALLGDLAAEVARLRDSRAALREALETLVCIVGLTAIKHPAQFGPLQEACDLSLRALKADAAIDAARSAP